MIGCFPDELKEHYLAGRLIPFVGAGVSASVKWAEGGFEKHGPSWSELVDQAARSLGFTEPDLLRARGIDLQILEYFGLKNYGQFSKLTNWLYAEMRPPDKALLESKIHVQLAKLDRCRLIYTTNYDDFIERSLALHGRKCTPIVIEAHMGESHSEPGSNGCEIVKFHGDFNYPDFMVISESHYERRLTLSTAMDYRFRSDLLGRAVLFVGYSFRDWNVSYLFRLVNEQFNQLHGSVTGRRAYITVADPSDFEIQLYRARNIEVIPISSMHRSDDIAELLEEVRG